MINLDYQSRKPIYMQIVDGIERYVALEILKPEQQIPSIRDLATELGINPNTVKKAYEELEKRGVKIEKPDYTDEATSMGAAVTGGVGIGIVSIVSPIYISEVSPAKIRGTLVSLYQLAVTVGFLLAYLANWVIDAGGDLAVAGNLWTNMWNAEMWRGMLGSETLPALLFFSIIFFIPESPKWLIVKGKLDKASMDENDTLTVTCKIKNTGAVAGYEIAQLYVADKESTIYRPAKELKGFKKVWLEPGESKEVEIELCKRAFAFYNVNINDWCVESGDFDILVGASSADIRLSATVNVSAEAVSIPDYSAVAPLYYTGDVQNVPDDQFIAVLGRELPPATYDPNRKLSIQDTFESCAHTKNGARFYKLLSTVIPAGFAQAIALQTPIKNFISMSFSIFSPAMAEGLLVILNEDKMAKGLGMIFKSPFLAVKTTK